jgi:hypothetical protein
MIALLIPLLLAETPPNLYTVKAKLAAAEAKVGAPTALEVKFDVAKDAHISDEAPLTIKLSGDGVTFEKPVLHYADALKPTGVAPSFKEVVTPTAPGAHTVDVEMSFYVCTAELCNKATEHQKLTLAAK